MADPFSRESMASRYFSSPPGPRVSSAVVDTANTIAAYGDRAVLIQKKPFATPGWVCGEIGPKNTAMIQRNAQFDGADFDASMAHVPVVLQALNRTAVVGYGSCAGNREGEGLFYAMPVPTPVSEPEKK